MLDLCLSEQINLETSLMEGFSRRIKKFAYLSGAPSNGALWAERAAFAISQATKAGHVCISLNLIAQHYNESLLNVRTALKESGIVAFFSLERYAEKPLVIDRDDRLYLARYFNYEYQFAYSLVTKVNYSIESSKERISSKYPVISELEALRCKIIRYFGQDDSELDTTAKIVDWQRVAAIVALTQSVTIISGGPGTGKTTTVVGILACLLDTQKDLRIALAAPTGKAAKRMQEAIYKCSYNIPTWLVKRFPTMSYTLHRLLGGTLEEGFYYCRDNPLPYEVILVDEASMIDIALAFHLIDAIGSETKLILLGDKDQLASVDAGSVFSELSARRSFSVSVRARIAQILRIDEDVFKKVLTETLSPIVINNVSTSKVDKEEELNSPLSDCVVWLERNYRFGLDSSIGKLSSAIRRGSVHEALSILLSKSDMAVTLDEDALSPRTIKYLCECFSFYIKALRKILLFVGPDPIPLFDVLNCFRILCATRTGSRGSENMNSLITLCVRRAVCDLLPHVHSNWFPGRPIIITHNSYKFGIFNGDIGIVFPDINGVMRVWFKGANSTVFTVLPEMLPLHETAFALTVHKSQGSEFDNVTLILPARFIRILTRELIYTAVTRARKRVRIISDQNILAKAIATRTLRDSGIISRINEIFEGHLTSDK